jgi:hypothetical protein
MEPSTSETIDRERAHRRVEPVSRNLTRDRLNRCIAGTVSLLVLTCIAIFGVARHFAV